MRVFALAACEQKTCRKVDLGYSSKGHSCARTGIFAYLRCRTGFWYRSIPARDLVLHAVCVDEREALHMS